MIDSTQEFKVINSPAWKSHECNPSMAMTAGWKEGRVPCLLQTPAHKIVKGGRPFGAFCEARWRFTVDLEDDAHWVHCVPRRNNLCHLDDADTQRPHIHLYRHNAWDCNYNAKLQYLVMTYVQLRLELGQEYDRDDHA